MLGSTILGRVTLKQRPAYSEGVRHGDSQRKANTLKQNYGNSTGVDCHFLLQGLFPTQGSNPGLPHCRQTLYRLSHQGSPLTVSKHALLIVIFIESERELVDARDGLGGWGLVFNGDSFSLGR